MGFTEQNHISEGCEVLNKVFSPEFRNRLDNIIQFNPLNLDSILFVIDKFLIELQTQLDDKKLHLHVDDEARQWLLLNGYDKKMGARPMYRLIQNHVKKPLAEKILFGDISKKGGDVIVSIKNEKLEIEIKEHAMAD
jgi:ATP-dependent Clp protease ATP-binding subunit ClpA